jgi:hypothetical protein
VKFGKRLKKAAQTAFRGAYNVTHKGPIGKLHDKIAKAVPAPFNIFVKIGTASSDQIHKLLAKGGALKKSDIQSGQSKLAAKVIRDQARAKIHAAAATGNPGAIKARAALEQLDRAQSQPRQVRGGWVVPLDGIDWKVLGG